MIGILLINLGTPDEPTTPAVRRYLRQFLSDPRVIDINPVARWLLLNLIILPFRSSKSAKAYRKVWFPEGSPLLFHTKSLASKVSEKLGDGYRVAFGMRYGSPSIETALKELLTGGVTEVKVLPLFPQYATSSYGSAVTEVMRVASTLWNTPPLTILPPFYVHSGFIRSFVEVGKLVLETMRPDHLLFSFHGLPERHILKSGQGDLHYCYRTQCFETAKRIAQELEISQDQWSVSFQSRLGRTPWIRPYTDHRLIELAQNGKKKIAVFCPSFVADCLETLEEIGIRGQESVASYGTEVKLIPSLNSHPLWVKTVCEMLKPSR